MLPVILHNLSSPLKKKKDTASSHVLIVKISHGLRTSAWWGGVWGGGYSQLRFSGSNHQRAMCQCTGSSWGRLLRQHPPHGSSNLFHKLPAKPPAAFLAADANLPTPSGNSASTSGRGEGGGGGQRSSMIRPSPVI